MITYIDRRPLWFKDLTGRTWPVSFALWSEEDQHGYLVAPAPIPLNVRGSLWMSGPPAKLGLLHVIARLDPPQGGGHRYSIAAADGAQARETAELPRGADGGGGHP